MAAPTLSELYSYRPNPDLAQGDRDVVPDNSEIIKGVTDFYNRQTQLAWNKYAEFNKNLKENFNEIKFDFTGIVPSHRDELQKDAAEYYKLLGGNISVLANPSSNPEAYSKIKEAEQKLNSKIAKSKNIYNYTEAQNKYMAVNDDLNTEKNKAKVTKSLNTPIDEWSAFTLDMPMAIDFSTLTTKALEKASSTEKNNAPIYDYEYDDKGEKIPLIGKDKKQIVDEKGNPLYKKRYTGSYREEEITKYNKETFDKEGELIFDNNMPLIKGGAKIKDAIMDMYNSLGNDEKVAIEEKDKATGGKDPLRYFFKTIWDKYYINEKNKGSKVTKDLDYAEAQRQQRERENIKLKADLEARNDRLKANLGNGEIEQYAEGLLQKTAGIISEALKTNRVQAFKDKDRREHNYINLNLTQPQLAGYGMEMNGSFVAPDEVLYNPTTGKAGIIFYDKNDDGTIKTRIYQQNGRTFREPLYKRESVFEVPFESLVTGVARGIGGESEGVMKGVERAVKKYNEKYRANWKNINIGGRGTTSLQQSGESAVKALRGSN